MVARRRRTIVVVDSLSTGGARVVAPEALAVDERVKLVLELEASEHTLPARVTRVSRRDDARFQIGIAFDDLPDPEEDLVARVVTTALAHQREVSPPAVLVLGASESAVVGSELVRLGRIVRPAPTRLAAMGMLDDPGTRFEAVIVEDDGGPELIHFLVFLQTAHGALRRLVMSREPSLEPEIAARVHAVLALPFQPESVGRALGIEPQDGIGLRT